MSQVRFINDDTFQVDDDETPIDFCSVSLTRPSDHYRLPTSANGRINPYAPPPRTRQSYMPHHLAARFIRDPVVSYSYLSVFCVFYSRFHIILCQNTTLSSFSKVANLVLSPHEDFDGSLDLITPKAIAQASNSHHQDEKRRSDAEESKPFRHPPPALPLIPYSQPQHRLPRLTFEQYELNYLSSSPNVLFKRIFQGVSRRLDLARR